VGQITNEQKKIELSTFACKNSKEEEEEEEEVWHTLSLNSTPNSTRELNA
jgi:hypothetical protein